MLKIFWKSADSHLLVLPGFLRQRLLSLFEGSTFVLAAFPKFEAVSTLFRFSNQIGFWFCSRVDISVSFISSSLIVHHFLKTFCCDVITLPHFLKKWHHSQFLHISIFCHGRGKKVCNSLQSF